MKSAKQSAFKMFVGSLPQCAPKKVSVPNFKYFICRFKYATRQSICRFSNPVPKILFPLTVTSAYFLRTFTICLPLCSQKYRSENILPIPSLIWLQQALFHHLSSFLIIYSQVFILQSSFYSSPFIIPSRFCFPQHSHLDYSYSYKVWCKYACPFISNTVKIQLQCDKSTVNV